jgi:hypothetical protein
MAMFKLKKIKGRTLLKWHAQWLDGTKYSAARAFIKKIRVLFGFGLTMLDDEDCQAHPSGHVGDALPGSAQRHPARHAGAGDCDPPARLAWGWGSVALAQALQFEVMLRQKDVIGEHLPAEMKEGGPGIAGRR